MGSVRWGETLEERLSNPLYKNWIKCGICLFRLKNGLENFVWGESAALHFDIWSSVTLKPCGNCTDCDTLCFKCQQFKGKIQRFHSKCPNWGNTDVRQWADWQNGHWSIARCFMNEGQLNNNSPAAADISAILNFIINCKRFMEPAYGNLQNNAKSVRENRNKLIHCGVDQLSDADLSSYTSYMLKLIEDENPDGKLKGKKEAEEAKDKITEVMKANFVIYLEDEIKVRLTDLEGQMDRIKSELRENNQKLQLAELDTTNLKTTSTTQGQKIEKTVEEVRCLKEYNEILRPALDKIREDLDAVLTLRTGLVIHDEISKLSEQAENNFKSLTHQILQYKRELDTLQSEVDKVSLQLKQHEASIHSLDSKLTHQKALFQSHDSKLNQQDDFIKSCDSKLENHETQIKNQNAMVEVLYERVFTREQFSHKDLTRVQKLLIKTYQDLQTIQINPVFTDKVGNIEDFFTDLVLVKATEKLPGDKIGQPQIREVQSLKELFFTCNDRINRIVLKASAGLGKSTFCRFLVHAWCLCQKRRLNDITGKETASQSSSKDMKDGEVMLMFNILLYINLGAISTEKDLIDVIHTQIPILKTMRKLSTDELSFLMEEVEDNKVLLIMDGLDEMTAPALFIEQTLTRKLYPSMTVLVSSRPWKIDKLRLIQPAHIDLLICIRGLSPMNSMIFAQKIFERCYGDGSAIELFRFDVRNNIIIQNIIHVPLLMLFIVHVWYRKKCFPKTVLHLYLEMLDVMVDRYKERKVETRQDALISWHVEDTNKQLRDFPNLQQISITKSFGEEFLLSLCDVASHYLLSDNQENTLVFDESDLLGQLGNDCKSKLQLALDIGLLSKQDNTGVGGFTRKISLSFLHKTIQELLAAIHLCCTERSFSHFLSRLRTYNDVLQNEIIVVFIAGISPQRCERIFERIFETCDDDEDIYKNIKEKLELGYSCRSHPIYGYQNREDVMLISSSRLYRSCERETTRENIHFRLRHLHVGNIQEFNTTFSNLKNVTDVTFLFLDNVDFTSEQCQTSWDTSKCVYLKYLMLRDINLGQVKLDLSRMTALLVLVIWKWTMTCENAVSLCNTLQQCTQLQELNLQNINLHDGKLDLSMASCLLILRLDNVTMSSNGAVLLCNSLSQCINLKEVTLNRVNIGDGRLDLSQASCLSHFRLFDVTMSSENTVLICNNWSQLHELKLVNVNQGDGVLDLSRASCLSIVWLHIATWSSNGFVLLCNSLLKCTQLKVLDLINVNLGDGKLDLSMTSCLLTLSLQNVTMSSECAVVLCSSLLQCTQLQMLKLLVINLHDGKLDFSGASHLFLIDLYDVTLSKESAEQLCTSLSQLTNLGQVCLENINLGNGKLCLSGASCISSLTLSNVILSSESVVMLFNSLSQSPVRALKLYNMNLGDAQLDFSGMSHLYSLTLKNVTASNKNILLMCNSLSQCAFLHHLTLLNLDLGDTLLDLDNRPNDTPYYLLLDNVTVSSQCSDLLRSSMSRRSRPKVGLAITSKPLSDGSGRFTVSTCFRTYYPDINRTYEDI